MTGDRLEESSGVSTLEFVGLAVSEEVLGLGMMKGEAVAEELLGPGSMNRGQGTWAWYFS